MAKTYAVLETKYADLATDFGLDWATKLFGAETIASLPVRASGKNKGKPKGFVIWRKASVAGYSREVQSPLAVGQLADAWLALGMYCTRSDAMSGYWMGRTETLALSRCYLFEDGRQRRASENAFNDQARATDLAEMRAEAEREAGR